MGKIGMKGMVYKPISIKYHLNKYERDGLFMFIGFATVMGKIFFTRNHNIYVHWLII